MSNESIYDGTVIARVPHTLVQWYCPKSDGGARPNYMANSNTMAVIRVIESYSLGVQGCHIQDSLEGPILHLSMGGCHFTLQHGDVIAVCDLGIHRVPEEMLTKLISQRATEETNNE